MYTPPHFAPAPADRGRAFDLIDRHGFAVVATAVADSIEATHVPILLDRDGGPNGTLYAHVASPNPIWRAFGKGEALAIFQGPDAYISPDWYESPGLVPTWNYTVVHAYGVPAVITDERQALALLDRLSAKFERELLPKPMWTTDKVGSDRLSALLKGIVWFSLPIARLIAKEKLSQNRSDADRLGAEQALAGRPDEKSRAVAALMHRARTQRR